MEVDEVWRWIPGFEGRYQVSTEGRVLSVVAQDKPRLLKIYSINRKTRAKPRLAVTLCNGGVRRMFLVYRLVLLAFVGPCPEGMEACHWDDDTTNNKLENLRWGTRSDNAQDMIRNGNNRELRKRYCPKEHEYTPENTYVYPSGARQCRICREERQRNRVRGSAVSGHRGA